MLLNCLPGGGRGGGRRGGGHKGAGAVQTRAGRGAASPKSPPKKKSSGGCSSRTRSPQSPGGPSLAQVGARPAWFCCRERGFCCWGTARGPPLVPARGTAPSAARKKCKTQPSVKLPPTPGACPHRPVPRDGDSHRAAGEHQEMPRQQLPTLLSSWGTTTGGQTSKKGKKGLGHGSQLHRLGFFCSCSGSSAPAVPGSYARLASNPQQNLCCHSHDRQETHAHGCTLTGNLLRTLRRATLRKETKTQLGRGGEEDLS